MTSTNIVELLARGIPGVRLERLGAGWCLTNTPLGHQFCIYCGEFVQNLLYAHGRQKCIECLHMRKTLGEARAEVEAEALAQGRPTPVWE